MAKKVWREWELVFGKLQVNRWSDGTVSVQLSPARDHQCWMKIAPADARRLFQQLSRDYKA